MQAIAVSEQDYPWFLFADTQAEPASSYEQDQLVRSVLGRDRKAIATFVELFSGRVYSYVRSRLAPRTELVEDVVHETFVAAWQRLGSFRGDSSLDGWIIGIARHKIEDHYRDRLSRMEVLDDSDNNAFLIDAGPPLDLEMDRRLAASRALAIIEALPEQYATILLWRYWEQHSSRQIAEAIGRTEKAVERLLARAREQFKRRWLNEPR